MLSLPASLSLLPEGLLRAFKTIQRHIEYIQSDIIIGLTGFRPAVSEEHVLLIDLGYELCLRFVHFSLERR